MQPASLILQLGGLLKRNRIPSGCHFERTENVPLWREREGDERQHGNESVSNLIRFEKHPLEHVFS